MNTKRRAVITADVCPDYIVHYYEAEHGPFHSLSDLSRAEAEAVLAKIRAEGILFASKRNAEYLSVRRTLEEHIRQLFIAKGGQPKRPCPHYYGDSFPAMRCQDGKPYRNQVYVLAELQELIERYGLPQVWNPEGRYGPERYVEAQLWDDKAIASLVASSP